MTRVAYLLMLGIVAACAATEMMPSNDSAEVAALVRGRLAAALAGDTAAWHAQVSDSCVFTGAELRVSLTKDLIGSIGANRTLNPKVQRIDKLVVHLVGGVAQATYVQLVQDAGQPEREGKRFRKADTYARSGDSWRLIGAAEVPIPFRAALVLPPDPATQPAGRYTLGMAENRVLIYRSKGAADVILRGVRP